MTQARLDGDLITALLRGQDDIARALNPRVAQPREHVSSRVWSPLVDVYQDADNIVIKADLPGMKQEEIDVEMADDTLTIRGERRLEEDHPRENYVREERQFGAFQRTFTIGVPIETAQVSAQYRNGVLEVRLPKSEVTKPKKVQVSVA